MGSRVTERVWPQLQVCARFTTRGHLDNQEKEKDPFVLRLSHLKLFLLSMAIALTTLASASVALANSASGTQDPNITITASLVSNPDPATTDSIITASASETNNTGRKDNVSVTYTVVYPDGRVLTSSKQINLFAGQTQTQSRTYTISSTDPRGTYMYTVSATDANGTSSATTSIVVS
jgi:hypothetical protein